MGIPRGDDPPYAIDENKIYIRSEAETGLAVRDEIVQLVAAAGTAEDCKAKEVEYIKDGATSPIMYPLGPDPTKMIRAFAKND